MLISQSILSDVFESKSISILLIFISQFLVFCKPIKNWIEMQNPTLLYKDKKTFKFYSNRISEQVISHNQYPRSKIIVRNKKQNE
jgi:hypothetical protein